MSQLYTLEEIKLYNGKNGAKTWVVINDIVYDVTEYLEDHPGGGDLITDAAGRDCTREFEDFGHSSDAKKILAQFKIGELVEEDKHSYQKKKSTKLEKNDSKEEIIKRRRKFKFFFCA